MKSSSKFVVATHIMATLAVFKLATGKCRPVKSDFISASVNTNAVVVRRILGMLQKAGLVESQTGPDGGSQLVRHPKQITLYQIYEAVDESDLFHLHYQLPNQSCPIGYNIQDALSETFSDTQEAVRKVLAKKTIAEVAQEIMDRSGISEKLASGLTVEKIQQNFAFNAGKFVQKLS